MKWVAVIASLGLSLGSVWGSTLNMVSIYQPLSRHGTDGNEIFDIGETLQATVMATPMVLTGSFPETLAEAISQSHRVPTNSPQYKVTEANLMVLCKVSISATLVEGGGELQVTLDTSSMEIPPEVDLTARQILKLVIISIRKTLEEYQKDQTEPLKVSIRIRSEEATDMNPVELATTLELPGGQSEAGK